MGDVSSASFLVFGGQISSLPLGHICNSRPRRVVLAAAEFIANASALPRAFAFRLYYCDAFKREHCIYSRCPRTRAGTAEFFILMKGGDFMASDSAHRKYEQMTAEVKELAAEKHSQKVKKLKGLLSFCEVALETFEEFYPYDKNRKGFNSAHTEVCKDIAKFKTHLKLELSLLERNLIA